MPGIPAHENTPLPVNARERFLAACRCEPLDRPPVWLMRQAGRFLPEYRALKARHDFLTLVRTPELATEVTLQPVRRFAFDAAILFSDILVVPEALGQGYHFREGGGICMDFLLSHAGQVAALAGPEAVRDRLGYVEGTLRLLRAELSGQTALLGFAGSPWTLATYMVEGGAAGKATRLRAMADDEPALFEALMEKLTAAVADYLRMQIESGVDAVQIFDTWGMLCGDASYQRLSLDWIHRVIVALPRDCPVILFVRGMAGHASALAATGARVISVDWTRPLSAVQADAGGHVAVQGNLEPGLLDTTPERVRSGVQAVLADMAGRAGHIFNLGHGILPTARIENVEVLVQTVRDGA